MFNYKILFITSMSLLLYSCAETSMMNYSKIDKSNKTIYVPAGSKGLKGAIKQALVKEGWKLRVYKGPSVSKGSIGIKTDIETNPTYKSKYRLMVSFGRDTGTSCSYGLGSWTDYEITIIDNAQGVEVLTLSGRNNCGTIVEKLLSQLNR